MRRLPVSLALLLGACGGSASDGEATSETAGGKADGFGDEALCPEEVALNDADGSAKRCYDVSNGQFVASQCCASVCEGASMRAQSNGDRCAWTDEPGMDGAELGQFAPQLCCDLNADLACGRATLSDDACVDPETGTALDGACCEPEPQSCHPSMASIIDACVYEQTVGYRDEALPIPDQLTLFDACVTELELVAGDIEQRCAFQPDLPFCGLEFEAVANDFIEPCAQQARESYDCAFGITFYDTPHQANVTVVHRAEHDLDSARSAPSLEQEQIIAAVSAVYDEPHDLDSAIRSVDEERVNVVELFDLSASVGYTAIEFGAGDNSYGVIFRAGTTELAANINDGDIYECKAPLGAGGNTCSGQGDCAAGFQCEGTVDDANPISTPLGLCVDVNAPGDGSECSSIRDCDAGYCAGLIGGFGMCSPGWMFGERTSEVELEVDGDTARDDVLVYGQATVPMDLQLRLGLFHDTNVDDLRIELLIPAYDGFGDDERPRITVWPNDDVSVGHPTGGYVEIPVRAFSDESINGAWTLQVTDTRADGNAGGVWEWTLGYSSRWD